jgi:serine/threonine protein kinase
VFAGDFRILEPLSAGGMGTVYLAEQLSTGKRRALKLMHAELEQIPKLRERFAKEARVGGSIRSQHVVEVVAAGVDERSNTPWIAMELLSGEDLSAFVARQGALPFSATVVLLRQVCHALGAAHAAGIVHRDLKPENVFLARAERADVPFTIKLLDFGIAKLVSELTRTQVVGTLLFMAPEQLEGRGIVPATDVWALGLVAFYLMTGKHYWLLDVGPAEMIAQIRGGAVEPASSRARRLGAPRAMPLQFDAWFARALDLDPARRFANAERAFAAFSRIPEDERIALGKTALPTPLAATAPATTAPMTTAPRRRAVWGLETWQLSMLAVLGVALALVLLWVLLA